MPDARIRPPADQSPEPASGFVRLRVWDWQDAVAAADGLRPDAKVFALTVARYGRALTGDRIKIKSEEKAQTLGVSVETIGRRLRALVDAGYLVRTKPPGPDGPAEYSLYGPVEHDRTHVTTTREGDQRSRVRSGRGRDQRSPANPRHDHAQDRLTFESERSSDSEVTHVTAERDRDVQKQVSNLSSSQSVGSERDAMIAEAKRIAAEARLNGRRAGR